MAFDLSKRLRLRSGKSKIFEMFFYINFFKTDIPSEEFKKRKESIFWHSKVGPSWIFHFRDSNMKKTQQDFRRNTRIPEHFLFKYKTEDLKYWRYFYINFLHKCLKILDYWISYLNYLYIHTSCETN